MDEAATYLRGLARRIVAEALRVVPLRAALLAGSAGRGDADFYSDIDLLLYVDELPPAGTLDAVREASGGGHPVDRGEAEGFETEVFELEGVRTEVSFVTVGRVEWRLDQFLGDLEEIDTTFQKIALGVLEGLPLHGAELVRSWQASLCDYPEPLRRAMIERHWRVFPLWFHTDAIAARDAELWRLDVLLAAAFDLLAVLAGLNRLYYSHFELKRMRKLVAQMQLAPAKLPTGSSRSSAFRRPRRPPSSAGLWWRRANSSTGNLRTSSSRCPTRPERHNRCGRSTPIPRRHPRPEARAGAAALAGGRTHAGGDAKRHRLRGATRRPRASTDKRAAGSPPPVPRASGVPIRARRRSLRAHPNSSP